jgi:hypothetical protein
MKRVRIDESAVECSSCRLKQVRIASAVDFEEELSRSIAAASESAAAAESAVYMCTSALRFPLFDARPALAARVRSALVELSRRAHVAALLQAAVLGVLSGDCATAACAWPANAAGESAASRFIISHALPLSQRLPRDMGVAVAAAAARSLVAGLQRAPPSATVTHARRSAAHSVADWLSRARLESADGEAAATAFLDAAVLEASRLSATRAWAGRHFYWFRALLLIACSFEATSLRLLHVLAPIDALGWAAACVCVPASAVMEASRKLAASAPVIAAAFRLLGATLATGTDEVDIATARTNSLELNALLSAPSVPFLREKCGCGSLCGLAAGALDSCIVVLSSHGRRPVDPFEQLRRWAAKASAASNCTEIAAVAYGDDERADRASWEDLPSDVMGLIADFAAAPARETVNKAGLPNHQSSLRCARRAHAASGRMLAALSGTCTAWRDAVAAAPIWRRLFMERWKIVYAINADGTREKSASSADPLPLGFVRCLGCRPDPSVAGRRLDVRLAAKSGHHDARGHRWAQLYSARARAQAAALQSLTTTQLRGSQVLRKGGGGLDASRFSKLADIVAGWEFIAVLGQEKEASPVRTQCSRSLPRACDVCTCAMLLPSFAAAREHLREHHGIGRGKSITV